jgi:hypothetical protein
VDNIWGDVSRAAISQYNRKYGARLASEPSFDLYRALRDTKQEPTAEASPAQPQSVAMASESYLPPWLKEGKNAPASRGIVRAAVTPPAPAVQRRTQRAGEWSRSRKAATRRQVEYRRHRDGRDFSRGDRRGSRRERSQSPFFFFWPGQ